MEQTSPEAVRFFLKQAGLEENWDLTYLGRALGVSAATARKVAGDLELVGYAEAVRGKRETWRNTKAGNSIAGVKPARLTRKTAEELLADVADRAAAMNLNKEAGVTVRKIVAFGGINTDHEKVQDIDLGVELEAKDSEERDVEAVLRELRGKSPMLKMHPLKGWMVSLPGRPVYEA